MRRVGSAIVAGNRPYVAALAALLVLGGLMVSGPFQRYIAGQERLELLELKLAALQEESGRLEQRRADLHNPEIIELIAREQLGFVKPGETPYVVVVPEADRPQVAPAPAVPEEPEPWWSRAWDAVTGWLR